MERVAVALSFIALMLLAALGGVHAEARPYYKTWATIEKGVLIINSPFIRAKINLSAGASITYLSVLNNTIYNCTASKGLLPGFHISTFTPQNFHNGSLSSLSWGPWNAEVVKNNTDILVVRLTPTPTALQDIEPLNLEVYLTVLAYKPVIYYKIVLANPSDRNITLAAVSLGNKTLGIDLFLNACPAASKSWSFIAVYGNATNARIYRFRGSNKTASSMLMPSNTTLMGAVLVRELRGEPNMVAFIKGAPNYYMAQLPPAGPPILHSYIAKATLGPGGRIVLETEAGVLPFNPALLDKAGLGDLAYVVDARNYVKRSLDEANHYSLVAKLNATIASLNRSINSYKTSLDKCRDEKSKLQSKLNELNELLDTCKVNLNITRNHLSSETHKVKTAAFKIAGFTVIGIIVGAIGGYIAALTRLQQSAIPVRGVRRKVR